MTVVISLTTSGRMRGRYAVVSGSRPEWPTTSRILVVVIAIATVVVRARLEQWQLPDIRSLLCARQCAKDF